MEEFHRKAIAVKVEEVGKKIESIKMSLTNSVEKLKIKLCQALEEARVKEIQKFVSIMQYLPQLFLFSLV